MELLSEQSVLVPLSDISIHPRNPNKGDLSRIRDSIEQNGFWGGVVVQKSTGYILVGNHRYEAAHQTGLSEIPVFYVDVDDAHALRILIADNRIGEFGERDDKDLARLLVEVEQIGLAGSGYTEEEFAELLSGIGGNDKGPDEDTDPNYERKVEVPVYEPKAENPPPIEALADETKAKEILARIESTPDIPEDVRNFLRLAAARHVVFDYEEIAEFYCHASKEVQELFEDSALVIIDFDSAVEKGFLRLVGELGEAFNQDNRERASAEEV